MAFSRSVCIVTRGISVTAAIFHFTFIDIFTSINPDAISFVTNVTGAIVHSRVIITIGVKYLTTAVINQTFVDIFASFRADGFPSITVVTSTDVRPDGVVAGGVLMTCPVVRESE